MKRQSNVQKKVVKLKDNHTWKAPNGYVVFVADRGAVSFNMPEKWQVMKFEPVEIYDAVPPNDNVRLSMSYWRLPQGIDWSGLPQDQLLLSSIKTKRHEREGLLETSTISKFARTDLEILWVQSKFLDPVEKREAYSRVSIARGWDVQVLITFDFWVTDQARVKGVWQEVMRSLQLGRVIQDPTVGEIQH